MWMTTSRSGPDLRRASGVGRRLVDDGREVVEFLGGDRAGLLGEEADAWYAIGDRADGEVCP
ncbi:hypothetical protein C6376_39830 [Streptomyces sp. P3]|nr:hypothetical protein C6376_39830 [Streptomyces sp. P3]